MGKNNLFRKPQDAWRKTKDGIELKYPIFYHNPSIPDDPIIKKSTQSVIGDVDFWGWEKNKEDRIVDSSGNVFFASFEKHKGYWLFIIPTEYRSGIFPGEVERKMGLEEIKCIMISACKRNIFKISKDLNNVIDEINSTDSIKGLLTISDNYL